LREARVPLAVLVFTFFLLFAIEVTSRVR